MKKKIIAILCCLVICCCSLAASLAANRANHLHNEFCEHHENIYDADNMFDTNHLRDTNLLERFNNNYINVDELPLTITKDELDFAARYIEKDRKDISYADVLFDALEQPIYLLVEFASGGYIIILRNSSLALEYSYKSDTALITTLGTTENTIWVACCTAQWLTGKFTTCGQKQFLHRIHLNNRLSGATTY